MSDDGFSLLEQTKSLGVELLDVVLGGLALEVLFENIDDVVGLDALLSLVGELLHGLRILGLLDLSLDLLLNDVLVREVDAGGPAALRVRLLLGFNIDPLGVDLR